VCVPTTNNDFVTLVLCAAGAVEPRRGSESATWRERPTRVTHICGRAEPMDGVRCSTNTAAVDDGRYLSLRQAPYMHLMDEQAPSHPKEHDLRKTERCECVMSVHGVFENIFRRRVRPDQRVSPSKRRDTDTQGMPSSCWTHTSTMAHGFWKVCLAACVASSKPTP
jgi:hypothetical protein